MPRFTYRHAGETHIVDIDSLPDGRWRITVDGLKHHVEAVRQPDGGWRMQSDAGSLTAYVAAQGERRYIWLRGEHYVIESAAGEKARRRTSPAAGGGRLTAQMPGQVRLVLVQPGDQVVRGQLLLVLEAMKMELRVVAPLDGTIQQVHVVPGAVVEREALLIELNVSDAS
jgi:biotin carboxyl carrier protein